ncbi:hypothetical protein HF263_26880 [Rhizobium leguminosarum]|uniref:hypothetical protein n=1 Tax=Rhizobium leguminosarum TaxID=384 RepID=UPI001C8FE0AF|nr:hypothetical protein [Rhizobium leguminosarum]MBY2994888.1 hypothetical protein [Rhizobium leguminosarum]MBY3059659.1 hypothetical protein [Rhizobium leguminosarum]
MAAIFLAVGLELNVGIDLVPLLLLFPTSDVGEEYQRQSPVDGLMTRFRKVNIIDLTVRRRLALSTQIYFPKFSNINLECSPKPTGLGRDASACGPQKRQYG